MSSRAQHLAPRRPADGPRPVVMSSLLSFLELHTEPNS
jgi:hypothetical protein